MLLTTATHAHTKSFVSKIVLIKIVDCRFGRRLVLTRIFLSLGAIEDRFCCRARHGLVF